MKKFLLASVAIAVGTCIAATAPARADVFTSVPEASNYTLVYSLAIPDGAGFNFSAIPYTVDNHLSIGAGTFSRIAYYLELQKPSEPLQFAYVSVDAFTNDAGKIGVPNAASGAFFEQSLTDMNVVSNVPAVITGIGINTGSMEFWQYNYGTSNTGDVPGASSSVYDFGDQPLWEYDYGSMQISNFGAQQTIFAYNDWGNWENAYSDLGIGNQVGGSGQPDWTFAHNGAHFVVKNLEVLVLQNDVPEPASVALFCVGVTGLSLACRGRRRSPTQEAQKQASHHALPAA